MLKSRNIYHRWILSIIVESGNRRFWGLHKSLWRFFGFYFPFVRGTKTFFPHARENTPGQPLLRPSWLVLMSPHPLEAIKTQDPVTLSIFIFLLLYLTPVNNGWTSSPTRSVQPRLLSNSPPTPTADTAFLDLPFLTIFVGVIVYADKHTHQKLTARWYWWVMKLWNCYDPLVLWSKGFFKMTYRLKQSHKFTLNDNI
jgi:hypothetical protein